MTFGWWGFGASSQIVRNRRSPPTHTFSLTVPPLRYQPSIPKTNLICPRSAKKGTRPSLSSLGQPTSGAFLNLGTIIAPATVYRLEIYIIPKYTNRCFFFFPPCRYHLLNRQIRDTSKKTYFFLTFDMLLILPPISRYYSSIHKQE